MADGDEFDLIARHFAPLAAAEPGALGLADDAAVLAVPAGRALVVTADMLLAGVHFLPDDPAESVGRKVIAVNLSDLAAMGADPRAYVLTLALPATWPRDRLETWLAAFVSGLAAMQAEFGLVLVGGDTTATPGPMCLSVTAFGTVPPGGALRRSDARPGDTIWVSGNIGDGVLGLKVLSGHLATLDPALMQTVIERYRRPQPRVALGRALVGLVHACADVSDGLIADLRHICRASRTAATIEAARVPLSAAGSAAVRAEPELLAALLTGGDDYELVFTAPDGRTEAIARAGAAAGVAVTAIGRMTEGEDRSPSPLQVIDAAGRSVDVGDGGWRHF